MIKSFLDKVITIITNYINTFMELPLWQKVLMIILPDVLVYAYIAIVKFIKERKEA